MATMTPVPAALRGKSWAKRRRACVLRDSDWRRGEPQVMAPVYEAGSVMSVRLLPAGYCDNSPTNGAYLNVVDRAEQWVRGGWRG